MKKIIESLKFQIENTKKAALRNLDYIDQLRGRRTGAKSDAEMELELEIEKYREHQNEIERTLSDLRYSLMFALRANGVHQNDIDSFYPEMSC